MCADIHVCVCVCVCTGTGELTSGSDNRDIMDDGASQELTEQNVTDMKGQGASGKVHPYSYLELPL